MNKRERVICGLGQIWLEQNVTEIEKGSVGIKSTNNWMQKKLLLLLSGQ